MNVSTLFKVLALVSANKNHHGELTGVPVRFSPDAVMHPNASLRIDLNNRESHVDISNGNNAFNSSAPLNSTDRSDRENEVDTHDHEITALEVWHDPNTVVFKTYFPHEPASEKRHTSPREALASVVKRMEDQTFERLHNVYVRIGEFNDYNYQKYQEIQYLSYSEKEKQKIVLKSQELKDAIMPAYVRLRVFIKATERYRAKLTTWSDDQPRGVFNASSIYWPQPETVPEMWYLLYNTETIIMQLFTPKPPIHTFLNESTHLIRMMRAPTVQMIPRSFIPVPQYNIHNNNALDRLFAPTDHRTTGPGDAPNEFERATFSKDDYEQQVIVFYMFKYFEYKTGDLARHVNFISSKLQQLEASTNEPDLVQIKQQKELLAAKVAELQHATIQMETYRYDPELINVYNAEANAIKFLPGMKHITKLIGGQNKRVTVKTHAEAVDALELEHETPTDLVAGDGSDGRAIAGTGDGSGDRATAEIPNPLEWDKNWPWDF